MKRGRTSYSKTMKEEALVITSYFDIKKIPVPTSLKEMQTIVGGYIELIQPDPSTKIYVNEEGLLEGLPLNMIISEWLKTGIVGDVLVISQNTKLIEHLFNCPFKNNRK